MLTISNLSIRPLEIEVGISKDKLPITLRISYIPKHANCTLQVKIFNTAYFMHWMEITPGHADFPIFNLLSPIQNTVKIQVCSALPQDLELELLWINSSVTNQNLTMENQMSPYSALPKEQWKAKTQELIKSYPLELSEIQDIALLSWDRLWSSEIGGQISLSEVELPATVVGYFFQKLFAYELSNRYPAEWRGEIEKNDKDLVHKTQPHFSTEMKSSGQAGFKIFGNRSYNQETLGGASAGKTKSGYYITLNFTGQSLNLIRLGWIDQEDWVPQGSETGQAATLHPDVYTYKMVEINGSYRQETPVRLLQGVGDKSASTLEELGINTLKDLNNYSGDYPLAIKVRGANTDLINKLF
ncbi:TPA: ScaI family restriction endonuclease [Vibrio vulnificus]|nr:ScaI family restriction endonuclease [Vibrio vulnificus]HDY7579479.1 ScaI family restriction endonuclease [Vibrio vulnificus]